MIRFATTASVMLSLCTALIAQAQTQKLPPDLAALPDQIKTLKWQTIDPSSVSTLEHCRSLLLLNHALDELSSNATAEADLMSTYIEKQNLGTQFAATAPPPAPTLLTYPDAEKISLALLRGPMSNSYYATELGDASPAGLISYAQLYERTCQRRWSEFDEARHQVRCMTSFLGNSGKLPDYEGWATAEAARRQAQYEQSAPANQPPAKNREQLQQMQQALAAAEYRQLTLAQQQTAQAQQQTAQAQQQAAAAQQANAQTPQQSSQTQDQDPYYYPAGYVAPGYYGAYGAYGYHNTAAAGAAAGAYAANNNERISNSDAAAAGAAAANRNNPTASNARAEAAGAYHGSDSSWSRSSAYTGNARSQTEERMSSFHGGGRRR